MKLQVRWRRFYRRIEQGQSMDAIAVHHVTPMDLRVVDHGRGHFEPRVTRSQHVLVIDLWLYKMYFTWFSEKEKV